MQRAQWPGDTGNQVGVVQKPLHDGRSELPHQLDMVAEGRYATRPASAMSEGMKGDIQRPQLLNMRRVRGIGGLVKDGADDWREAIAVQTGYQIEQLTLGPPCSECVYQE